MAETPKVYGTPPELMYSVAPEESNAGWYNPRQDIKWYFWIKNTVFDDFKWGFYGSFQKMVIF